MIHTRDNGIEKPAPSMVAVKPAAALDETAAVAPAPASPMQMLHMAVERGASLEVLERLIALQERMESNQARRAFDAAIANAKTNLPPIPKNKDGHNGRKYASMDAIARIVDPIITQYGLSYRFRSTEASGRITM